MKHDGGPWTMQDHVEESYYDQALASGIRTRLKPKSVLDVGCGRGRYLRHFRRHGIQRLQGIEPLPMGRCGVSIATFDPTVEDRLRESRYHVVLCLEVAEHVPRERHTALFDFITRHTEEDGRIVFSGATPGQGGHGHISERPEEEWVAEFAKRGWIVDRGATMDLRRLAALQWFQNNVTVYGRRPQ